VPNLVEAFGNVGVEDVLGLPTDAGKDGLNGVVT
jgi:hypothetical protein